MRKCVCLVYGARSTRMTFLARFLIATALTVGAIPAAVDYARDVRPILQKRCYGCHGAAQQMSNLRLDRRDAALRVIKPGDSAGSKLHAMVSGNAKLRMPPNGPPLPGPEIAVLKQWIDSGANWPAGGATASVPWSFAPLRAHRPASNCAGPTETKSYRRIHPSQARRLSRSGRRPKRTGAPCCAAFISI